MKPFTMHIFVKYTCITAFCFSSACSFADSQSEDDLAKATANPVADLISVPFQSNWDKGYGVHNDQYQYTMNMQPVVPFQVSNDWNLITRTIIPFVHQPAMSQGQDSIWGIGDTSLSLFFSPRESANGVIWGAGPVFYLPTGSNDRLGLNRWAAGPTGVVLIQSGPWTYGALANQLWQVSGPDTGGKLNISYLNPFVSYSLGGGWTTSVMAEWTYNWEATTGRSTIPLQVGISKIMRIGSLPVSVGLNYRNYVKTPTGTPDYGIRMVVSLLFPK